MKRKEKEKEKKEKGILRCEYQSISSWFWFHYQNGHSHTLFSLLPSPPFPKAVTIRSRSPSLPKYVFFSAMSYSQN